MLLDGRGYMARLSRRADVVQIRIERFDAKRAPRPPAPEAPVAAVAPAAPAAPPPRAVAPSAPSAVEVQAETRAPSKAERAALAAVPSNLTGILASARAHGASDVHIVSGRPVLVRTAGELLPWGSPVSHEAVEAMLLPLLEPSQRELLQTRGYVDLGAERQGAGRLRVNVSRQKTGLKGSFRLVMEPLPTLESLGLPQELAKVTNYHQGFVVIAGPSGHGKTTTLAAIVDIINSSKPHHILTVEEPVEFIHQPKKAVVSQRDVGHHTKSFATALKASLREDPDVIVIGELRDRETVEIAITAAETGHLVIATMSTPSAAKTIDRLIDLFPPADQQQVRVTLAGALKFVVAQRLLPTVAGDEFVAAVELITGNAPLWAMIRENKLYQLPNLQQRGRAFGMIRFDDSLIELVRAGKITEETAQKFAENKKEFGNQLRGGQPAPAPAAAAPPPAAPGAQAPKLGDLASRAKGLFGGGKS
jgi:twitching motility protein PilT